MLSPISMQNQLLIAEHGTKARLLGETWSPALKAWIPLSAPFAREQDAESYALRLQENPAAYRGITIHYKGL